MALEALSRAYLSVPVGADVWMLRPTSQTLEDFQIVVAATEAWEVIRQIRILEIREEHHTGRRLIHAVRFQRLR